MRDRRRFHIFIFIYFALVIVDGSSKFRARICAILESVLHRVYFTRLA